MSAFPSPDGWPAAEPLRLLIIGAGKMGEAHAAAFQALPGVEVVGVVSQGGQSAQRLAARYGVRHWGTDWQQVAASAQPHACVVAVAHLQTAQVTAEAIAAGLHVLAEKPVALEAGAVQALAEAARAQGVVAMAAMNRRYYPSVTAALEMVRLYGPVRGVTVIAPDPVQPYRATGKYAPEVYDHWTQMNTLHAIDLLRLVGGEVEALCGWQQPRQAAHDERSLVAAVRFESGVLGTFTSYGSHAGQWELRIHGDGVEARLAPLERGALHVGNAMPRPLPASVGRDGLKPGLLLQARAFVEAIRDLGCVAWPGSDLFDHARSLALADQLAALPGVANTITETVRAG